MSQFDTFFGLRQICTVSSKRSARRFDSVSSFASYSGRSNSDTYRAHLVSRISGCRARIDSIQSSRSTMGGRSGSGKCTTVFPSSSSSIWRARSPSIARAMALKEFRFFISVRVPICSLPTGRTDRFTSARIDPSCSLQSEAPRYWIIIRSFSR